MWGQAAWRPISTQRLFGILIALHSERGLPAATWLPNPYPPATCNTPCPLDRRPAGGDTLCCGARVVQCLPWAGIAMGSVAAAAVPAHALAMAAAAAVPRAAAHGKVLPKPGLAAMVKPSTGHGLFNSKQPPKQQPATCKQQRHRLLQALVSRPTKKRKKRVSAAKVPLCNAVRLTMP